MLNAHQLPHIYDLIVNINLRKKSMVNYKYITNHDIGTRSVLQRRPICKSLPNLDDTVIAGCDEQLLCCLRYEDVCDPVLVLNINLDCRY